MSDTIVQPRHYSWTALYLFAFSVFAILLALRESEEYGHIYDFLPILGGNIPFFTLTILLLLIHRLNGWHLKDLGWCWPKWNCSTSKAILLIIFWAFMILVVRGLITTLIDPLLNQIGPRPATLSRMAPLVGNLKLLLSLLPLMWVVVIGEEFLIRGLLMNFLAQVFGGTTRSWVFAILISSVIFGVSHFWQGPRGMVSSGVGALVMGVGYYLSGRILWPTIIAHCFGNTLGFVSIYLNS